MGAQHHLDLAVHDGQHEVLAIGEVMVELRLARIGLCQNGIEARVGQSMLFNQVRSRVDDAGPRGRSTAGQLRFLDSHTRMLLDDQDADKRSGPISPLCQGGDA